MATQLSKDLRTELNKIKSTVQLARTIDGDLPREYAFTKDKDRQFHCAYASSTKEFAIILYEVIGVKKRHVGFARGVIKGLHRLAELINAWVSKLNSLEGLAKDYKELDIFKPLAYKNDNPEIEANWAEIKNKIFTSNINFWKDKDWDERYETMFNAAKRHKFFENLYPLTSHYNLRFMKNKQFTEGWPFYYSIVPSADKSLGDFCVQVSKEYSECKYFSSIDKALDFFATILKNTNTKTWT